MVHVESCRFLRVDCSGDEHPLFRREYARSNRERGVKLLRCFPHCCPEHAKRSYCGCSVHLLVTFSAEVSAAELEELLVCTRFEPSRVAPLWSESLASLFRDVGAAGDDDKVRHENERKLRVGETVQLPASLFELSAIPTGKSAVWVRAVRESDSMQRAFPKNTVLYVINKSRYPKWLYNYDSSTTRTQREMTHHLVAYVFRQGGQGETQDVDHHPAVVLARHPSPAFHVVSFRRIGTVSYESGCESLAADTDADDESSKLSGALDRAEQHQGQQQRRVNSADHELLRAGDVASLLHQVAYTRELEYRDKGLQLIILWQFLKCVSLADLEVNTSVVGAYLMRAATARCGAEREHVAASFLSDIFERTDRDESPAPIFGNTSPTKSAQPSPAHERAVVRVVVHLFLRAVSSCSVERLLRPAVSNKMTSNEELQEQFTSLVPALYDVLDEMFRESVRTTSDPTPGNQDACLSALVDAILSLVYNRDRFGIIRPEVSALLDHHQSPESLKKALEGWFQAYTAQARVLITSSATGPPNGTLNQHSPFCGRWVLVPQSIQVVSLSSNQVQRVIQSFRFTDVAQLTREVGCIDVDLNTSSATPRLCLLSALSFANDNTEARTSMLLDGRLRIFRALPSGLSSMIPTAGGWFIGDYVGTLSDDAQSLNIDLFAFAEGYHPKTGAEITVVRRASLTLTLKPKLHATGPLCAGDRRGGLSLVAHGVVYGSAWRPSKPGPLHRLSTASSADRAAVWSDLRWTPFFEMQAEYLGIAFVRK